MSSVPVESYLCERRSERMGFELGMSARRVSDRDDSHHWDEVGHAPYYFESLPGVHELIGWLTKTESGQQVPRTHIVDAGAYRGNTLLNTKREAEFETATALGMIQPRSAPTTARLRKQYGEGSHEVGIDDYFIGDMQGRSIFDKLRSKGGASLIVSRYALVHMYDQLAAIEQIADCLMVNGSLVVDYATPVNDNSPLHRGNIQSVLERSGLAVHAAVRSSYYDQDTTSVFATRITSDPIRLPIDCLEVPAFGSGFYRVRDIV